MAHRLPNRGWDMAHIDDPETQKANLTFIRASMKEPLLSRDHEFELAKRWRDGGDEDALHELVRSYTRLVVATASRFRNYGLPMGDLVQEGNVGLMQAAARFEPHREIRFSTYAAWWIRSAMQDYILRNWSIVRTGTTAAQKSLFFNLRRLRAKIEESPSATNLSTDGRRKIAEELNVDESEVLSMEMRLAAADQSLNTPVAEGGDDQWQDFIADNRPSPEDVVIGARDSRMRSKWLAEALGELSPRERTIIAERRLRDDGATLEELGKVLGVSKERVRQLEQRALMKLRASMMRHVGLSSDLLLEA
uniref:RNA polymerase factor sigma-32 n=1 Tax=Indioceanicola profundi TaxID=2220096 RepID=UPI00385004D0